MKKPVHIVPIWDKEAKCLVDTVWPGIGELRTTAFRTGQYAGRDEAALGDTLVLPTGGESEIEYPEWCRVTLYRLVQGQRIAFAGPKVYWRETYATNRRDSDMPNDMWATRPFGQLEKCAEAAALRATFPEEIGSGDYIPEEVEHAGAGGQPNGHDKAQSAQAAIDALKPASGASQPTTQQEPSRGNGRGAMLAPTDAAKPLGPQTSRADTHREGQADGPANTKSRSSQPAEPVDGSGPQGDTGQEGEGEPAEPELSHIEGETPESQVTNGTDAEAPQTPKPPQQAAAAQTVTARRTTKPPKSIGDTNAQPPESVFEQQRAPAAPASSPPKKPWHT
jgi:phage recombination protein Bet